MKGIELSPRLLAIAGEVPQGAKLADIGTDHAYLPIALLQSGKIAAAIAADVNEGPLSRGRAAAQGQGISEISFRCCDGLEGISPEEADTIVIAGMGGDTISHILAGVSWSSNGGLRYLLQPMSSVPELRQWLSDNGFSVQKEVLVREDEKLYVVFVVISGKGEAYSLGELWAGKQWRGMDGFHRLDYLDDLIVRRSRALAGLQQAKGGREADIAETQQVLTELRQLREEWILWQQ